MKKIIISSVIFLGLVSAGLVGCQKGNLLSNPNAASTSSTVPVSLIFNRLVNEIYEGGGELDDVSGSVAENPWGEVHRWNQY